MVRRMREAVCSEHIEIRNPEVVRDNKQEERKDDTGADHSATLSI